MGTIDMAFIIIYQQLLFGAIYVVSPVNIQRDDGCNHGLV